MVSEQEKLANRNYLWGYIALGMTKGIWDMVEESSISLSPQIGAQILGLVEKQLGVKISGEKPEDLIAGICKAFVEDFGYAREVNIESKDKNITVTLPDAIGTPEFSMLHQHGVKVLFSNPILCTGLAVLARSGFRARGNVQIVEATKAQIVSFNLI